MTIHRRSIPLFAILLAAAHVAAQAPQHSAATSAPASGPERVRAQYNAITSHLDAGGTLLVVANTDGVIEDLVETVRNIARQLPATGDTGDSAVMPYLDRLPAFLKSSGLYAVDGFGMSVVPRVDGQSDVKSFVYRDPAAAQLPFWQGIIGGAPKRLATLDYLPADTVVVRAGTADPRQLWKLINDAVRQVGGPDAAKAFEEFLNGAGKNLGTNLNSVIASLDAEQFFSLQLSSTQTMELPSANPADTNHPALVIPNPSLLIGSAVRDGVLPLALQHALQQGKIPVLCSTNGATKLYTVSLPVPLPFPFSPTFAVHRNMFLFGSTAEIVNSAIAAAEGPAGAHLPVNFQKAFAGLPKQNNGFAFIDRRFSETMGKVQAYMAQQKQDPVAHLFMFQQLMQGEQERQLAAVFVNEKDGIAMRGTTTMSGRQIMLSMAVAPVAMMSAVAIPSFMKSREASRNSACINNLRLIDHAKQQWAVENNKADADVPAEKDLAKYFKGGHLPVCPNGGKYAIRAVGEAPTCLHPGHALPE